MPEVKKAGDVILDRVRIAFPKLYEPRVVKAGDKPSYGATLILPPDHPQLSKVEAAVDVVGRTKWKDEWPTIKKMLAASNKLVLHDGDGKAQFQGFAGNWYISANRRVADGPPGAQKTVACPSKRKMEPYMFGFPSRTHASFTR